MMRSAFAALLLLASCSGGAPRGAPPPAAGGTRYEVGDFIVYRYTGAFTPAEVTLREEVTARRGDRLRIEVTATRGGEIRRWIQVVTDTPANQRDNVIDALYEVRDGAPVRLVNAGNQDAFRLYAWTFLEPEGRATDKRAAPCEKEIAGARFSCTCTAGRNRWRGRLVRFDESECPGFLWTHGPGAYVDESTGEDVLRTTVLESGRRAVRAARSVDPAGE